MILLDVTISDTGVEWLWIGGSVAFLVIIRLLYTNSKLQDKTTNYLLGENIYWKNWAVNELEKYKETELQKEAKLMLKEWTILNEASIRADAIKRSTAVHTGKVTEHFIPFMKGFPYNVKDARFIGSPIDLIIFDGHNEQREITIVFTEVKTGKSKLSPAQQRIKEAVLSQRVRWWETGGEFTGTQNEIDF